MNRIRVTKIGLLNFWLYDEEEYDFYGGNLILRGTNGSGKSVTMQSFIPLILDGNKSPDRLDPFGSKERKIEDYIIGESDSIQKEEATSYLYMETYNESNDKYITIGLGFRGRKGKPVDSWGFALKDGKRVGIDFFLYKDPSNKIPLSKNELKARLGSFNEFTDTTRDYKAMVNRLLFGFPNLDTYDEFIKLLLQLRSNKLSKDYKPTNLINVLNTVLQPLTEDDLRPLSEAIEQMNKTKEHIETLEKNAKSLKEFLRSYNNYNEIILLTKARNYKRVNDKEKELCNNIDSLMSEINNFKEKLDVSKDRFDKVVQNIELNNEMKRQLDNTDLKQKIESLSSINENISFLEQKLKEIENSIDKNEQDKLEMNNKIAKFEEDIYLLRKDIDENTVVLKDMSGEIYFDSIVFFVDDFLSNIDNNFSFNTIFWELNNYKNKIKLIKNLLDEEQKIMLESERFRIEFEKLSNLYKKLEQDIINYEKLLQESIMAWEEDFINRINNNKYLTLDEYKKKEIFELMNNYSNSNFEMIERKYGEYANELINDIILANLKLESKKEIKEKEIEQLDSEYQQINSSFDFEIPPLNEETERLLKEKGIVAIPLYKCIEFKDGINDKIKNNIEASLLDLNILNAKVVRDTDIKKLVDLDKQILYLTKTTKKKDNLLQYFDIKLDKNLEISIDDVKGILESISVSNDDLIHIDENGLSKIDVLNSISDKNYEQSFIGYLKRKELKEKKLKEIKNSRELLATEIRNIEDIIANGNHKIEEIRLESDNLPSNTNIEEILNKIRDAQISLSWNDMKQKELEKDISIADNKLKEIKDKIDNNKQGIYVPLNIENYKNVLSTIDNVNEILQNLKITYNSYLNKIEIMDNMKERLEDINDTNIYLKEDKFDKEKNLKINIQNRESINNLLETKEYKEQKDKLLKVEEELISLDKEKTNLIKVIAEYEKDINYRNQDLNNLKQEDIKIKKELGVYKEIFMREYDLHYVYHDSLDEINTMVINIIKDGKNRKDISLNEALNNFYSSFNHYRLELNDYSLKNITLFDDYNGDDEHINTIYQENTRVDVSSMYQGVRLNIIDLFHKIEDDIEENKDLISVQDRHLFEDILLNTVGEKIRNRINSSNEWVAKINNIMAKMQEDSALGFRLVWKSIHASSENEIDTRELVRILKMDPKLLKEEDTNKLTNHFRSKIKKAEELYQDSYVSFYKIIEDVLDYRNWFTFVLMYHRKGVDEKELTDKVFAKFSGGERAKSMYIPLFASVYAKLILTREDALRLIALDEAFAGVDEDNIREMFGILKYLDLDFIINSQVLWGDYDTIDNLSICELIRPQNSNVVTVERYRWNGKYKEIVNNRKEYNKELENA